MASSDSKQIPAGIFWGAHVRSNLRIPSAKSTSAKSTGASRSSMPSAINTQRLGGSTTRSTVRSLLQLPQFPQKALGASATSLASRQQAPGQQPPGREHAAASLLDVLWTLLRRIRSDTEAFVKSTRALDTPADNSLQFVGRRRGENRYYPRGVELEDREFFVREREGEADRDAALAATTLARELHCAVEDKQRYSFDRRTKASVGLTYTGATTAAATGAMAETARIDRHRRKIQHLLHLLQEEIAEETRREINFLEHRSLNGPASREARRQMALITKSRYEAADRIMRILEEYKIVVGVDVVDYLHRTIAEGKALVAGTSSHP